MRIAVGIASIGRPEEIRQLLDRLEAQTLAPCAIILSVECDGDVPTHLPVGVEVIFGPRGSCVQRNRCIDRVQHACDVILFFDDDYLPCQDSLASIAALFGANGDVVAATGQVLADGIGIGGIALADALNVITAFEAGDRAVVPQIRDTPALYGCNMAIRTADLGDIRFDESLPLYAWQEDADFAGQLRRKGRVVKTSAFSGVHRGVTRGRTSGVKLGYSQVINPVYLVRKGTISPKYAARILLGNVLANHVKALKPEPWIDRRGRSRGNWLAVRDILKGQIEPAAVLSL